MIPAQDDNVCADAIERDVTERDVTGERAQHAPAFDQRDPHRDVEGDAGRIVAAGLRHQGQHWKRRDECEVAALHRTARRPSRPCGKTMSASTNVPYNSTERK